MGDELVVIAQDFSMHDERINALEESAGRQYELITSIETTEEVQLVRLKDFELDEFALYINMAKASATAGANFYYYKNNNSNERAAYVWISNLVNVNNPTYFAAYGRNEKGMAICECTNVGANLEFVNLRRMPGYLEGNTPFTGIAVQVSSASKIPVGSKFELWGVRANA